MTSEEPTRRKVLGVLVGAAAAGVMKPAHAETPQQKPETIVSDEHPGLSAAKRLVQALEDFYKKRPKFNDMPVPPEDVVLVRQVVEIFLKEHAAAFSFDAELPRPPGFDVWSMAKVMGLALRGDADQRVSTLIEQELDRLQWEGFASSRKEAMPVWGRDA